MQAKSIKAKSTEELATALQLNMADGFKPTLAIVFVSVKHNRMEIGRLMDASGIAVFGVTTNGEFIDEQPETGSIVALLLDINKEYFRIYFEAYPNKNYKTVAIEIAAKAKSEFNTPAFIIGTSNPAADGEEVLRGFEEVIGSEVNAFGGGAGDDYAFTETFVFTNNKESNNALVCIAIDEEKVAVKGIATCGWKAVGTEKTVTKSEGNHVFTIDNVAALDITTKYGGLENLKPDNKDLLMDLAANFPLQLQREKGDPVMRPGLVVDWTDHSFYTSGAVPQGSKIRFSLPPDWDVMECITSLLVA